MIKTLIFTVLVSIFLSACAPVAYQKPDGGMYGGHHGYLDKEISPGVHVIEVQQIGGYQFILNAEETIETFKSHWKRRASELCPGGYFGEPEIIQPIDAKIEEFNCNIRYCQKYPMVSGVAQCSESHET